MDILKFPSDISLSGNMQKCIISTPYDISFVLTDNTTGEVVIEHSYSPSADHLIEVDLKPIIQPLLAFKLQNLTTIYKQPDIMHSFTVEIAEVVYGVKQDPTSRTFKVFRTGVDELADSPLNFLKSNFLTWQPNVKGVTYYSPEFLSYYASEQVVVKCTAYTTPSATVPGSFAAGLTSSTITLATLAAGSVYTIPVSYSVIASKLDDQFPSYYDIWIETESGSRLTYIQRYYADDMKSPNEQWVLFENSLGGIDTFRAYGNSENTAEHTHNVVEIDENSQEYRVDTERTYNKNTGYLDKKERVWLLDFFPSLGKYIYVGNHLRRIVVTESDASYTAKDLPSSYTFKYKYADARPYLNIPRTDTPQDVLNITVPDLGSFTIAPRLVEFPRLTLSDGALLPVQDPYSEEWSATSVAALKTFILDGIQSGYQGDGGIGHSHPNLSVLNTLQLINGYLTADGEKINAGYADKAGDLADDSIVAKKFLRKDQDDEASGVITFLKGLIAKAKSIFQEGIEIGNFVTGWLGGSGAAIDKDGNAEFESIKARGFIETPELRFNRIDVVSGELWNSICFGTIERVDTDRRRVYLKLEEGELSGIKVDDICRGIFHSVKGGNAIKERLDECNFIELAGFATSYFTPTEVYENGASFKYSLKPGTTVHPQAGMKFAVYGNFTDKSRQASAYQTRTYQRYLNKVDTWVIDPGKNIYMQLGLLDGLVINGYQLKDYGALMHNVYLSGVHIDFDRDFIESITPNVYSLHLTKTNFVVITDLEGNIIDGVKDTGNVTADETTEQANVTANTNTDDDYDNVTVGNMYLMRSVIQAYNGDTPLLYSEHIDEGTFIVELSAYGCTANAKNGVVTITDIDTSAEKIYVDVKVNCEGNIHLTKRIDITLLTEPENGVTADLDNEMTTLPSDDKGNVFAFDPIKVIPRLWYGNNPMVITRAYVEKLPDGITTNVKLVTDSSYSYYEIPLVDGVRTLIISGVSQSAADVNELLIAVEGKINSSCTNTYTKNTVFKLNKAKMGENAIRYELVPSTNEIIVDKDGNVKTSAVSCQVIEMDGKTTTTLTTAAQMSARGLTAKVRIYNASATGNEVDYTISSNVSIGSAYGGQTFSKDTIKAVFTLYHNGTLIDKEGVPVIRNGVYAVRLDLDNENDAMLYNGLGALVSGKVISNATLFDGTTNVNSAVSEWSMQGSTGCTASVSSNTITVTAMSADTGSVTIGAKYLGNIYTAVLSLKKLVGVDKYEIVTTPTSVTRDPNTGNYSHASITVDVYVTRQNGTREKNPDMGGAILSNNITGGTMTPGGTFPTSSFGSNKQVVFTVTRNGAVEDSETVPLLEAGLNGKKRIVIQPTGGGTRSYTYDQWKTWGAYGYSGTWSCSNASDVVVGDTGVIVGYVSDRGNISATIEGIVTSKTDTQVVMTSLVLTVKGDDGKDAEYDVIEVVDNTVTIGLTGAATGYIKWRAIHIKGSTRTEASVGASSHKIILNGQETNGYNGTEGNIAIYTFGVNGEQKLTSSGFTLKYVASTGGAVLVVQAAKAGESYFPVNRGILESGNTYHYAQNATTGIWERDFGMYPIGDAYYYFMVKNKGVDVTAMPTTAGDDDNWILMSQYKTVLADTLVGENCWLGGFLASEDYFTSRSLVSKTGEITDEELAEEIYQTYNIVFNGDKGIIVANRAVIRGIINAIKGTFDNCTINDTCTITKIDAVKGTIGGFDINDACIGKSEGAGSVNGMSLFKDFICFNENANTAPRQAIFGTTNYLGADFLCKLTDTRDSYDDHNGILFDIRNSKWGVNFAFKGNGNGVLNGIVQGYKVNVMTSGLIEIANGNTVYCSGNGTSLYLPKLAECQSILGTTGAFALDLCIIGASGADNFKVYGADHSTLTDCRLMDNNHNAWYATMSKGDTLQLKLIYSGASFYAYIINFKY